MLFAFLGLVTYAAQTDYFQITITVGYIGIELKDQSGAGYGTWDIGAVEGGIYTTMEAWGDTASTEGIEVYNGSNVSIDLSCWATNSLGWDLGPIIPSSDKYVMHVTSETTWVDNSGPADMSSSVVITATTSPGDDVDTGISAFDMRYWFFYIAAPTEVTTGSGNTITVTIEASGS